MNKGVIKERARKLRSMGKTYSEIKSLLGMDIPKSTLSNWCQGVGLPKSHVARVAQLNLNNLSKARGMAWVSNKEKRERLIASIDQKNKHLIGSARSNNVGKIALAMLHLSEGSKATNGSLMFGNSNPSIIRLFMSLLRRCYNVNESSLRCTVQCRADQDTQQLEKFWLKVTGIPFTQFYKSRVDPRTIGKPSKKPEYKGVCRIDYFSAATDLELKRIAKMICEDV